jgi:hypothetical protein
MGRSLVAALVLFLGACGAREAGRYPVEVDRVAAAGPALTAELRAAVDRGVARSPEFGDATGSLEALRLAAWISASDQTNRMHAAAPPRAPGGTEFVHVELEVPAELRGEFDVAAITARAPRTDDLDAAVASALQVLELRLALARGEATAAGTLLGFADPDLSLLALEWIRDHPRAELADAVAGAVEDPSPEVGALALEVLAQVGDARHASAVVRRVERSPGLARPAYAALGRLGGADAVGFLRFAAANEDDPRLREEAERALATALAGATERVAVRPDVVDLPRMVRGHRQ